MSQSDLSALLVEASEQAAEVCIPILEALAGSREPSSGTVGIGGIAMEDFNFQLSPEFTEDWDMLMSGTFNMDDIGSFDAFLS
jgi:hypothetical protein